MTFLIRFFVRDFEEAEFSEKKMRGRILCIPILPEGCPAPN